MHMYMCMYRTCGISGPSLCSCTDTWYTAHSELSGLPPRLLKPPVSSWSTWRESQLPCTVRWQRWLGRGCARALGALTWRRRRAGPRPGHSVKREDPTRYSEKVVRHRAADPATEGSSPPEKMRALLLSLVAFAMAEEGRGGYWTTPLTLHHEPDGSSPPPPSPSPPPPTPTTPCQTEEDLFLIRCADDAQSLGCLRPSLRDEFKCLQMNANELSDQCILSMRELSECLLAPRLFCARPPPKSCTASRSQPQPALPECADGVISPSLLSQCQWRSRSSCSSLLHPW